MERSDVVRLQLLPPCPSYDPLTLQGWRCWWQPQPSIRVQRLGHRQEELEVQIDRCATPSPPAASPDGQQSSTQTREAGEATSVELSADGASLDEVGVGSLTSSPSPSSAVLRPPVAVPPNFSSSPALPGLILTSPSRTPSTSPTPPYPAPAHSSASLPSPSPSPSSSPSPSYTFEYAHHKGYFLLPTSLYARHSVVTTVVSLAASHPSFGPFPLSLLTYHLYGYDSILLNHLIRQRHVGYMRNVDTRDITTLAGEEEGKEQQGLNPSASDAAASSASTSSSTPHSGGAATSPLSSSRALRLLYLLLFKSELLVTTLFLFFATTTLVSSTLTQTQLRMLHFTDQLRQHLRLHLPIVGLVLEHTMQSLSFVPVVVGILFFLFEFFNDQLLAFLLLLTVWLCESYTVLFTRTSTSMLYFPKLFALYFLMFGVYFFSFPYGFHYIAIALTASQLYTCMAYYLFAYEIPAVEQGRISIHRPRMLVLRRSEGEAQLRGRTTASAGGIGGAGGARGGAAEGEVRAAASSASSVADSGGHAPLSVSQPPAGRGREGELLGRLLGLWDERQRPLVEADEGAGGPLQGRRAEEAADPAAVDDGEGEEALQFSRRELRRDPPPPHPSAVFTSQPQSLSLRSQQPMRAGEGAQSGATARPLAATTSSASIPSAASQRSPTSPRLSSASTVTLDSFAQPHSTPSSSSSSSTSPPLSPFVLLPPLPSSPSSAPPDSAAPFPGGARLLVSPSLTTSRSFSSPAPTSSTSAPSSLELHPSSPRPATSEALQHLASLPPLLQSLLRAVQGWTSSSSTTPPHRAPHRRSRALSSSQPSAAPSAMPKELPAPSSPSPRARRSSIPPLPATLVSPGPSASSSSRPAHVEVKEQAPSSSPQSDGGAPQTLSAVSLSHSAVVPNSAHLHRAVLEQLAHVLQVALFVLTTLHLVEPHPPPPGALPSAHTITSFSIAAATTTGASAAGDAGADELAGSSALPSSGPPSLISPHPTSAPSLSPSLASPHRPQSPTRPFSSPRSSSPRASPPSSRRPSPSAPSSSPSPASRRLFTDRPDAPHFLPSLLSSPDAAAAAVGGEASGGERLQAEAAPTSQPSLVLIEPASPTDAPMM